MSTIEHTKVDTSADHVHEIHDGIYSPVALMRYIEEQKERRAMQNALMPECDIQD